MALKRSSFCRLVLFRMGSERDLWILGSELIRWSRSSPATLVSRRTEALAKEQGATHTFALVTGKYSAIAFDRLGHTLVSC